MYFSFCVLEELPSYAFEESWGECRTCRTFCTDTVCLTCERACASFGHCCSRSADHIPQTHTEMVSPLRRKKDDINIHTISD